VVRRLGCQRKIFVPGFHPDNVIRLFFHDSFRYHLWSDSVKEETSIEETSIGYGTGES
jgi:hypothetical protein